MKGISCDSTPSFVRSSGAIGGTSGESISLSAARSSHAVVGIGTNSVGFGFCPTCRSSSERQEGMRAESSLKLISRYDHTYPRRKHAQAVWQHRGVVADCGRTSACAGKGINVESHPWHQNAHPISNTTMSGPVCDRETYPGCGCSVSQLLHVVKRKLQETMSSGRCVRNLGHNVSNH